MRRVTVIFLTLIIAFGLSAFPASAVDNSQSYLLTLTSGGESVFSVEPGEELEVELKLDRTDRDGSFLMYAFSAGIRYNSSMLELVDAAVLQGVSMTVTEQTGSLNGWSDITLNALSSSINGTEWNDPETILKLKFRASQYGSSTLMIRRASVSTFSGMESFFCETKDVQVNVQKAQEPDHICPSEKYSDLYPEAWYHPAVDYVLDRSYFNGVSDRIFLPDGTMTRAMFVTVLSRLEGIDPALYADNDYSDVADGSWYAAAVQWASRNGIVKGVGGGRFDPEGFVTREQMAAVMYRYADFKGIDVDQPDRSEYDSFTDTDNVSDWAVEAMIWAVDRELIRGIGNGMLAPEKTSTRAQVAQIIKNYDDSIS